MLRAGTMGALLLNGDVSHLVCSFEIRANAATAEPKVISGRDLLAIARPPWDFILVTSLGRWPELLNRVGRLVQA